MRFFVGVLYVVVFLSSGEAKTLYDEIGGGVKSASLIIRITNSHSAPVPRVLRKRIKQYAEKLEALLPINNDSYIAYSPYGKAENVIITDEYKAYRTWWHGEVKEGKYPWILTASHRITDSFGFFLYGGVWKSRRDYFLHSRLKKINVAIFKAPVSNGKVIAVYQTHSQDVSFKDVPEAKGFVIGFTSWGSSKYKSLSKKFKIKKVYKFVRITVLETYKGEKYQGAYITQLW